MRPFVLSSACSNCFGWPRRPSNEFQLKARALGNSPTPRRDGGSHPYRWNRPNGDPLSAVASGGDEGFRYRVPTGDLARPPAGFCSRPVVSPETCRSPRTCSCTWVKPRTRSSPFSFGPIGGHTCLRFSCAFRSHLPRKAWLLISVFGSNNSPGFARDHSIRGTARRPNARFFQRYRGAEARKVRGPREHGPPAPPTFSACMNMLPATPWWRAV